MARVLLDSEDYNAATDGAEILGAAGTEQVNIFPGVTGVSVAANVERVDLSGNIADYTFRAAGETLQITDTSGNVIATVSGAGNKQIVFQDGALDAAYDPATTTLTLGGETIVSAPAAAAPITPAASEIDTGTTSDAPDGTGGPGGPGTTNELTTGNDVLAGTAGNDTFTGDAGTLQAADTVADSSTSDNDTLNVMLATADFNQAATISNIENINVEIDEIAGALNVVDATNITGATITLGSSKLGYNGVAGVTNAGDNNVTAGDNVTSLTVAGVEDSIVDAGDADTVAITAAATETPSVIVNGDVGLTINTATTAEITGTADAEIALTAAAVTELTVNGTGNQTVIADGLAGDEIVNDKTSGTLTAAIDAAATVDVEDWSVDSIDVNVTGVTVDEVDGAPVAITDSGFTTVVSGLSATDTDLVVSTADDQTSLTVDTANSATINVTADATLAALAVGGIDTTIDVAGDVVVTALTSTGEVAITGMGDVEITDSGNATAVDASALTGELTLVSTLTTADFEASAGSGGSEITINTATNTAAITGGAGVDEVDASTVTAGTIVFEGDAGDDTLLVSSITTGGTLVFDGGANDDTLQLDTSADLSSVNVTIANVETLDLVANATVAADQISGEALTVTGDGSANSTLSISGTANDDTIDLSTITASSIATTGGVVFEITGGAGADEMSASGTLDTFVYTVPAESDATNTDTITGFAGGADEIKFVNSVTVEVLSTAVTGATLGDAVTAAFAAADAANDSGLEALQFTYDGSTYVAVEGTATGDATGALVIELVGLTGALDAGDFIA
ncbi:beta strand repeat-containing protein [Marivita sp. S0852]|uniref:beta strand repeat-containing protein n=1 Tax=Marivita sp. S0852 TaxID=3373893 RepID=UPI003981FD70